MYHTPLNSRIGIERLLLLSKQALEEPSKIRTQSCHSEDEVLELTKNDPNSIGLTSSLPDILSLKSAIIDREELMLICNQNTILDRDSIDLFEIFGQHIWLPEHGSETLKIFQNKLSALGLDLNDFKHCEYISEAIMLDLIRSGNGMGIGLCRQSQGQYESLKAIRINEFTVPYAIYAHCNVKSSEIVQTIHKKISKEASISQQLNKPSLERSGIYTKLQWSKQRDTTIRIGIQSKTIQAVVAGRAIQKLGFYESFLNDLNQKSPQKYLANFKNYQSAAPILQELKNGNLDIAIAGDYAITHIANSLTSEDEKIVVVGFASINPVGSGSRLMLHKNSESLSLDHLTQRSIHVPFLSTAHGSLLYNLQKRNLLRKAKITDLKLEASEFKHFLKNKDQGLACFTPFDHFLESECGYIKVENEISMPFSFYGVIVRQSFLENFPDAVIAFLKAILCSNYWFESTPSSLRHLSLWTGVKESIINQILGERKGNDCHYLHDTTIRQDWITEFSSRLFIPPTALSKSKTIQIPLITGDLLNQARLELCLRHP